MNKATLENPLPVLNADMSQRVVIRLDEHDWQPSPGHRVWRKRLHLLGEAESGQVTSLVRYDAGSRFSTHPHPQGEEILVLSGVFSDEQGDWPAGSYLLNPEGFRHAPFSEQGCELFVKLRQYGGDNRAHVALDTATMAWLPTTEPGIEQKRLYAAPGFPEQMVLQRWSAGAVRRQSYPGGAEILVIQGTLADEHGICHARTWLRYPPGTEHAPYTDEGCLLYVKTGGVAALQSRTA